VLRDWPEFTRLELKVLLAIWYYNTVKGQGLSTRKIGDLLGVRSVISRIYSHLEREGLIRIETVENRKVAYTTEEGEQKLHEEFPNLLDILHVVDRGRRRLAYAQR